MAPIIGGVARLIALVIVAAVFVATAAAFTLRAGVPVEALLAQAPAAVPSRPVPADLLNVSWIDRLRAEQVKQSSALSVFHNFQFADRQLESGITFRHRIVDDAGKTYKAVHYDHGNGIAAADVDGDGRTDVYFVNQAGPSQLWRNAGGGRFEDITSDAGVGVAGKIAVSASFADIDNDGDADLFVTTVRGGNVLFENDGKGRFRDISAAAGVNYVGHSSSAVFFDYNRDGRLDLFVVNVGKYTSDTMVGPAGARYYSGFADAFSGHLMPERAEPSILYRNDGKNRFTNVSKAVGLVDTSWSGDASAIDVNEDGWLDLYVLNMQGDDQYYENAAGKSFVRKSRDVFPRTSWGAMGIKVFDVNSDGKLDIFITDMHSDMSETTGPEHAHMKSDIKWPESFRGNGSTSIWGNSLFVREGPGKFREASEEFNLETYWPWGLTAADFNADGYDDVFVTAGMSYPFRYEINSLKLNERGKRFANAEFLTGIEPRPFGVAMPWFELDASGADREHPDAKGVSGRISVLSSKSSRSSVAFDIDGDGDLDLLTTEFNAFPMVLVNNLSDQTTVRHLSVKLVGTTSNRDGLGAIVTVTAGGVSQTKVNDGNSGYLSHSVMPLYFGIGAATAVDRVEVLWPSGKRQTVQAPQAGRLLEIREN